MQLCAPANAALPLSQPWHALVLVRPPHLASWSVIFGLGVLAGAIVVVLTRSWLRWRAVPGGRQPSAQLPQPVSAPVAVAPAPEVAPARPEVVPAPLEAVSAPPEIVAEATSSAQAGAVLAVRRLLADLEDLKVTLADGPPALVERLLNTAATEVGLGTAGHESREVILVGFDGHDEACGAVVRRESVGAALDLIAAKTVTTRRSLSEAVSDGDQRSEADLGLTLLVSRIAPARSELSLLIDLVNEPGRVAALLPALGQGPSAPAGQVSFLRVRPGGADTDLETSIATVPAPLPADLAPAPKPAPTPEPLPADPAQEPPAAQRPVPVPERERRPEPDRPKPPASLRIGMLGQLTINGQPGALLPAQTQLIVALAVNGPAGLSNSQLCDLLGADAERGPPGDRIAQQVTGGELGYAPSLRQPGPLGALPRPGRAHQQDIHMTPEKRKR